jgi:hypothetical protein
MRSILRFSTAALVGLNGLVHLQLWRDGYQGIDDIGVLFLANAVAAAVLAVAVLVRPVPVVLAAAGAFSGASLVALVLSRTTGGFLGFREAGWSPEARQVLVAEVGAMVTAAWQLALGALNRRRNRRPAPG